MPDPTFEARLARQLQTYALGGVRPIDRHAIAEATIAAGARRGLGARLADLGPALRLTPRVALTLSVLLALAIALLVVGRQPTSMVAPGRLAFIQDGDVFVARSDGSDAIRVLDDPVVDFERVTTLPDADHLAVEGNGILAILDLTTGERRRIGQTDGHVTWDDSGRFAYVARHRDQGRPVVVIGEAVTAGTPSEPRELTPDGPVSDVLALSPDGQWLATILDGTIYRIDAATGATSAIGQVGQGDVSISSGGLSWSPDSGQLVIATQGVGSCVVGGACTPGGHALLILDVIKGGLRQLTNPEPDDASGVNGYRYLGPDLKPGWSPDGQWIAFRASPGLSIVRPDGTDRRDLVTRPVGWFAWATDSTGLEFVANESADDAMGELSWVSLSDDAPRSLGLGHVRGLGLRSVVQDEGATPRSVVAATEAPGQDGRSGTVVPAAGGAPVDPTGSWRGLLFSSGEASCQSVLRVGFDDLTVRPSAPDGCFPQVRISPDGRRVAIGGQAQQADGTFAAGPEGRVAVVELETGVTTVVRPGDDAADAGLGPTIDLLRWSPGGRWLAWDIGGETWIISADGTASRMLPSGGWPEWSPDDAHVAVETRAGELVVGAGSGADIHVVGPAENAWGWSGGGSRYAIIRDGDAWLANADGSGLRNVTDFEFGGASGLALSPDGETLAVVQQARVLWLIDSDGTRRQVDLGPDVSLDFVDLHWSPDATRVAIATRPYYESSAGTLYLVAIDGSPTTVVADARNPIWSPDGRFLAFLSGDGDGTRIDMANADGSGRRSVTDDAVRPDGQIAWLPTP
jgi:Tol biopolymer transport system component